MIGKSLLLALSLVFIAQAAVDGDLVKPIPVPLSLLRAILPTSNKEYGQAI
jgi:hypothetical protein